VAASFVLCLHLEPTLAERLAVNLGNDEVAMQIDSAGEAAPLLEVPNGASAALAEVDALSHLSAWSNQQVKNYLQSKAAAWADDSLKSKVAPLTGAELASALSEEGGEAQHLFTEDERESLKLFLTSNIHRNKQIKRHGPSPLAETAALPEKVQKWFAGEGVGLDEVELWDIEEVRWFFQKIGREKASRKMVEAKVEGPALLFKLRGYDAVEMAKFDINDEAAWNDIKLELWAAFHKNEEDAETKWEHASGSGSDGALVGQDKCPICSEFEITYTFGFEWGLFPTPSPWPNPIHTWVCDPLHWQDDDVDMPQNASLVPSNATGKDASAYAGRSRSKASVIFKAAKKFGKKLFWEPVKTLLRCSLCGLCALWEKVKAPLAKLGHKWRKFLATAKDENKYKYRHEYDRLRMSLFEAFSIVDKKRDGSPLDTSFLQEGASSELSSAQLAAAGNKLLAQCWQLVGESEERTYDAFDRQMMHMVLPDTRPEVSEQTFRPPNVPASLYQGSQSVHLVPKECQEKFDPRKNFKKYRSAFSWGLNVEMPNLEEAFKNLITGQWVSMLEALVPEVLLMVVPVSHKLDECIAGQKEAKEQFSVTCTPTHLGMCDTAMKYQMLTEMVEAEWPPLDSPGWWKRRKITKALTRQVDETCIALKDFKKFKKAHDKILVLTDTDDEVDEVLEEAKLSRDFEDCRVIKQKVHDVDFTDAGVALYGPKIWFSAAQAWFLNNFNEEKSGEATFLGAGEPKVDNFVHQFCSALLHCDLPKTEEKYDWNSLLSSYDAIDQTATDPGVALRKQMYDFWGKKLEKDRARFDRLDRKAQQGLTQTFRNEIKPLFMEFMDLDRNPFVPPPPMKPVLAEVWYKDIKVKDIGVPKLDFIRLSSYTRWIFLDARVEEGCAMMSTLHEKGKNDCNKKCVNARTEKDLLCLMDADDSEACETFSDETKAYCRKCLSFKRSYLVDYLQDRKSNAIEGRAYQSLYDMDHPVQTDNGKAVSGGVNKYVTLHGYFEELNGHTSNLRQTWVNPIIKDGGANAKWQWISRVLKTARDAGSCPCMNEKLREYINEEACANTRWVDGTQPACVSVESTVPGTICWDAAKMKNLKFVMQNTRGLQGPEFIRSIGCFPNVNFADSEEQCASIGMTRVPMEDEKNVKLIKFLADKIKLDAPRDKWSVEKLVGRLKALEPADDLEAARVESGLNCLEKLDGMATVPLLWDNSFRVWTTRTKERLSADTKDLSGSFKVDFDFCRKKSILEARESGDENPVGQSVV